MGPEAAEQSLRWGFGCTGLGKGSGGPAGTREGLVKVWFQVSVSSPGLILVARPWGVSRAPELSTLGQRTPWAVSGCLGRAPVCQDSSWAVQGAQRRSTS